MSTNTALGVAESLRNERLRVGLTQADVAAAAGVSKTTYRRFERSGGITLDRLIAIAAALGMNVNVSVAGNAPLAPDPRVARVRRRGLRRPKPAAPSPKSETPPSSPPPAGSRTGSPPATARPTSGPATTPRRAVDAQAAAAALRQHRDAIVRLVGVIVNNRLNNYAAFTPTQNVMRAQHVANDDVAFVAAVEGELARLTGDTCASFGIDRSRLASWQEIWRPELGIVDPAT